MKTRLDAPLLLLAMMPSLTACSDDYELKKPDSGGGR